MKKKLFKILFASFALLLISGCNLMQPQPQVQQQIIKKTIETKEVLIPHNDNIKKAVAIIILKLQELESKINSTERGKGICTESNSTSLKNDILLNKESISKNKTRLLSIGEKIKTLEENLGSSANEISKQKIIKRSEDSNNNAELNEIIRDFVDNTGS